MATIYLYPDASPTEGWSGVSPHWQQIDEANDPPGVGWDANAINNGSAAVTDIFTMTTVAGTPLTAAIYAAAGGPVGGGFDTDLSMNGGVAWLGTKAISGIAAGGGTAWYNTTDWDVSAFANPDDMRVKITGPPGVFIFVDQLVVKLTYNVGGGGGGSSSKAFLGRLFGLRNIRRR